MKAAEKTSIEKFDDKNLKIRTLEEEDNKKAVITHYLHNLHNDVKNHYEEEALTYLNEIAAEKNGKKNTDLFADPAVKQLKSEVENVPFKTSKKSDFKFIDLFAGIGGFRIALQNIGGECVYTSEWNADSKKTYQANFGEFPFGDITQKSIKNYIPDDFQILCAGFPCQAFSIAGNRKGFHDTRGTLFFDLEKIIETKRPKVVFLENVKNLVSHDKGNTFKVILEILEEKLGYKAYTKVLNSSTHANVPQNRERIFIIAFDKEQVPNHGDFKFPEAIPLTRTIHDILEKGKQADNLYYKKDHQYYPELEKTITSKDTIYQWRRVYVRENKSQVCPTLTANMGTGGHNVPLILDDYGIRKLTPKECFAFQGYPMDKYILPNIANSKLYMQAGNSVTTPLIERISQEILNVLLP